MRGKIIGAYGFDSKAKEGKPSRPWVRLFIQQDMPEGGYGVCVENLLVSPERLPTTLKEMVNKTWQISTNNNFASDFYLIDK